MKRFLLLVTFSSMALSLGVLTSCRRSSDEVWNDTRSATNHVKRGVSTLGGKHGESRQIGTSQEFSDPAKNDDFIALDADAKNQNMNVKDGVPQAKETPGELGSSIPGIEAFRDPAGDPKLAPIFKHIHFEYNSSLIKGGDNMAIIQKIGEWLKKHSKVYIFIEGHCDERGPAAFNLALGANRANAVRALLVKEGADADHMFTISYGKEKPLAEGHDEDAWKTNRRSQFRIFEKE